MLSRTPPPHCYNRFMLEVRKEGLRRIAYREISLIEEAFGMKLYPPHDFKVFEIPYDPISSGAFDIENKTLQLIKSKWCIPTLVHELLHATSFFVKKPYIEHIDKIEPLIESATEFLTGYVLWKKHPHCYKNWISQSHELCSIQYTKLKFYRYGIRAFALLAEKTSIREIAEIYFWQPGVSLEEKYRLFIERHVLRDFIRETLSQEGRDSISALIDALTDAYGENLVAEYIDDAPLEYVLDYSRFKT